MTKLSLKNIEAPGSRTVHYCYTNGMVWSMYIRHANTLPRRSLLHKWQTVISFICVRKNTACPGLSWNSKCSV